MKLNILIKILIPLFIALAFFLYLKFTTKYWDSHNKVSFVFQKSSGDVAVTVLDPMLGEQTTLIVPGDTEINVAHNYGVFRIKNVWQLGLNEKFGGGLLAQTVTNNFLFPTFLWTSEDIASPWQFIFTPKLTNISFGDRLSMVMFAFKVKNIDKTEIDLGKNQFLKRQILTDGLPGFVMNGPVSGRLTVYFSDNNFSINAVTGQNIKFGLIDETMSPGVSNNVGSILEVLGGKVVSIEKRTSDDKKAEQNNLDCQVYGKNIDAVKKVATLFNCQKTLDKTDLDMVMLMGIKFGKRF